MKLDFRQRLLGTTLLVGANLLATPAFAQDAPPTDGSPTDVTNPSGPIEGQPTPSTSAEGEPVSGSEDIIVTGSRIPQPNLESASPITVVSDQDVKLSGTTRIEDLLGSLPSAAITQNAGLSNSSTGTAEVDLRYLGAKRTLTLVNGRRLVPGDPNGVTQAADLNFIPASLVKRVEVLTGGASSVYGADAVAGVVNFIMDTNFTGIRFDGQVSFYQHNNRCNSVGNGRTVCSILDTAAAATPGYGYPKGSVADGGAFDGTVSIGTGFDDNRGHAVAYFGYRNVRPVTQARRDRSVCALAGGGANISCGGSNTSGAGNALLFDDDVATGTTTFYTFGPNRTLINDNVLYNYNPLNYFQRPDERYVAGAFANYEIDTAIKPYLEFMFMDDHTLAQIAPSGDFFSTYTLNCDNPLMSAQAQGIVCSPENLIVDFIGTFPVAGGAAYNPDPNNTTPIDFVNSAYNGTNNLTFNRGYFNLARRNVEGGPRISDLTHTSFRGVLGTRGDLSKVWSYDAYFQYGRTHYTQVYRNEFSTARLLRALDVIDDPRTAAVGDAVCRSVVDNTDPNCVPYDIFATPSAAAINYLNVFGVITGRTSEQVANFNVTGALGEMGVRTPWAEDGFGVNAGVEYRKESLTLDPDQSFQTNDLAGQGAPTLPVDGNFRVLEWFAEAQMPLVQHNFIEDLTLGAGYRKSNYKLSNGREFDTDTYKLSLEFAPIRDIRFRGAYNRAVRAPNIQELFAPLFVGLDGSSDPCSAGDRVDAGLSPQITAADYGCLYQGMVVGQGTPSNPAAQYNGLIGGNPDLTPEKATTKTIGVVLQPSFLPRFAATIDYWTVKVNGAVQGFGADAILADCVANSTATFEAPSCALVHRNAAGSIWLSSDGYVIDTPSNVGGVKTDGYDFNASYSHELGGIGNLSASFNGTYLRRYITDNGLTPPYDCAGFYGSICSGGAVASASPMPKWRHKLRTTLQMPSGIGLSLQWRHIGKVKHERLSDDVTIAGTPPVLSRVIKAENYFDLASTFTFGEHYNFRLGVNNLFDNDPPLVTGSAGSCAATSCNGNTYPGTYDALGRYFYAGVTLDF